MIVKPVNDGVITCTFDQHVKRGQKGSFGTDIASLKPASENIPIMFIYDCLVVASGLSSTFGNRIWVQVTEGVRKDKFIVYPHLDTIDSGIQMGKTYKAGAIVGYMGNTGLIMDSSGKIVNNNDKHIKLPKGRHVHIECRERITDGTSSIKLDELEKLYI